MDGYTAAPVLLQARPDHPRVNYLSPERALRRAELAIYVAIAEPQYWQPFLVVKAAMHVGRFVGSGMLSSAYAAHRLLEAAIRVEMPENLSHHMIDCGIAAGCALPIRPARRGRRTR